MSPPGPHTPAANFTPFDDRVLNRHWEMRAVDHPGSAGLGSSLPVSNSELTVAHLHRAATCGDLNTIIRCLTNDDVRKAINTPDHGGATALSHAVFKDAEWCVAALLNARADPNVKLSDGRTALHVAAYYNKTGALKRLLQNPMTRTSEINFPVKPMLNASMIFSRNGVLMGTPLHFAAEKSRSEAFLMLVKAGADAAVVTFGGETALHVGCRSHVSAEGLWELLWATKTRMAREDDAAVAYSNSVMTNDRNNSSNNADDESSTSAGKSEGCESSPAEGAVKPESNNCESTAGAVTASAPGADAEAVADCAETHEARGMTDTDAGTRDNAEIVS